MDFLYALFGQHRHFTSNGLNRLSVHRVSSGQLSDLGLRGDIAMIAITDQAHADASKKDMLSALAPENVSPVSLHGVALETVDSSKIPSIFDLQHQPRRKWN